VHFESGTQIVSELRALARLFRLFQAKMPANAGVWLLGAFQIVAIAGWATMHSDNYQFVSAN